MNALTAPGSFALSKWNEIQELSLDRPLTILTTTAAFTALGLVFLAVAPSVSATVPLSFFAATSFGAASPFAAALVKNFRHIPFAYTPISIALSPKAFTPKSCPGGSLYYHEDIPILHLTAQNSRQAGYAQGYLTGSNIHDLWKRYLQLVIPFVCGSAGAYEQLKATATTLTIPPAYREEMQGIVEGYNKWLDEYRKELGIAYFGTPLTYADIVLWHTLIDLLQKEGVETPLCGTVAIQKKKELLFARNLDLPSLSILGPHFLLIRREIPGRNRSAVMTLPGTVGSFTGMNQHGLTCATSSAGTLFRQKGVPSLLIQRQVLDYCKTTEDARRRLSVSQPASSHLLTIADMATAFVAQFSAKRTDRNMDKENHLIATNHFVDPQGFPSTEDTIPDVSEWRYRLIENDLHYNCPLIAALQRAQSIDTTQSLLFYPAKRKIDIRLGNAYAAIGEATTLNHKQLFG